MLAYVVRRIFFALLVLSTISFISFVIIQLPPGDFVDDIVYSEWSGGLRTSWPTPEEMYEIREYYGLNRPLVVQYWDWISNIVFHAEFGWSYSQERPIKDIIAERLPYTILLTSFTTVLIFVVAMPIGVYSAVRQHSIGDYTFTLLGFTGLAVPDFLLALVLMYVFFAYFDQSVGGLFSGDYVLAPWSVGKVIDMMKHLIIPCIVLGTAGTAGGIRTMRNNLLDELNKPYVVTARSKGIASWKVIVKYPVRVAINPFVSGIGGMLPALVGGSVIVSVVLSLPTLGPVLLSALYREDAEMAGSILLLMAALSVVGVLISDLLLVMVDPRISLTGRRAGGA